MTDSSSMFITQQPNTAVYGYVSAFSSTAPLLAFADDDTTT
jgi:hypothetical protein